MQGNNCTVKHIRDGLIEEEHYGYFEFSDKKTLNIPFYMRSCAKPLQASLIIDYGLDKYLSEEEIALCCSSHAGERIHTEIAQNLLYRMGLDESYLKCGLHKPLSKSRQYEMHINNEKETVLHNNCSGKHIMMLGLCKLKKWNLETYYEPQHPLQIAIKNKINELCCVSQSYPVTTDGCGVPIVSMPLFDMLKGYLNLFSKYEKIKNAFLNKPYIIGGEDRTDTFIMQNSKGIIAKVGAGGLCIVVNVEKQEAFAVKISDCDMKTRELVVCKILNELKWANIRFFV